MKPKEGCAGCGRMDRRAWVGCETILDELRPLGLDCWRPHGVVFIWDEREEVL